MGFRFCFHLPTLASTGRRDEGWVGGGSGGVAGAGLVVGVKTRAPEGGGGWGVAVDDHGRKDGRLRSAGNGGTATAHACRSPATLGEREK